MRSQLLKTFLGPLLFGLLTGLSPTSALGADEEKIEAEPITSFEETPLGLGMSVIDPTGFTAKYYITRHVALDAAFGWSLTNGSEIHFHTDGLYRIRRLIPLGRKRGIDMHFGVGIRVSARHDRKDPHANDTELGVRLPMGLDFVLDELPIESFFEFAPAIDFTPSNKSHGDFALGGRWFF